MKILITGASGFIGGFLVEEALRRGYETWAGIRAGSSKAHLQDKRIHFIDLKYGDQEALTAQLSDFAREHGAWDYVIHNAGLTKTLDKRNFFRVNAENTHRFIEALAAAGCKPKKFLLMSSLSSYGRGDEKTFRPIRLDDPQRPDTAYGQSKLEAENYIRKQIYFPYVILRPTGVYGPGEKDYFMEIQSVKSGLDFAVGAIPQRITFIYVKDLATVAFLSIEQERVLHARIPLGLVRIACHCSEWIGKLLKKSMTLNSDKYIILKQRNWICDVTPLQDDLGFIPAYPLRKGLEESIEWYKKEGWL